MGEGLKKLNIKYIFRGLSLEEARALLKMVKQSYPVYSTIKKKNRSCHRRKLGSRIEYIFLNTK